MGYLEFLVILTVTAFRLAIVSGRIRANELVTNPEIRQLLLKQRGVFPPFGRKRFVNSVPLSVCMHSMA